MKLNILRAVIFLLMLSTIKNGFSQKPTSEVFTISTCNVDSMTNLHKLELQSSKASIFRITGINPLRYKYFINNQAVTQFMESSLSTFSLSSFVNKGIFATAPEIKIPEIFKTDSVQSDIRSKIREYRNKNKQYEDSIDLINSKLNEIWFNALASDTNKKKQVQAYYKDPNHIPFEIRLNKNQTIHDKNLREYFIYTSGLPLNDTNFGILSLYKDTNLDSPKHVRDVESIRKYKRDFAIDYCKEILAFKRIYDKLFMLETNGRYTNPGTYNRRDTIIELKKLLSEYNFIWAESMDSTYRRNHENDELSENIRNVKEQILNKEFQIWEAFVLNIETRIGVLIQKQFRESSSFNNTLLSMNCLDSSAISDIQKQDTILNIIFEFVQRTNAELQALVPYLDINTELYQSIAKKINANYVFLLSYLQNLDFASKSNSIQYTLPTHNNLKNIDLVRYTLKREDKITGNTQDYDYDLWLKGGLKVDYSAGMFITRLTDNVYNKVLLETTGGVDKIKITREDDGRASFAFGGMVNIIPRNGAKWLNAGGSIGLAYSDNKTLQALAGLALHFGKTERVIVHAGAGFGTIKYLDISANDFQFFDRNLKSYPREKLDEIKEKDRVYMLQSADIKFSSYTIPTINKFVIRPFIGITYNLSKKNALQAVSGAGAETYKTNYDNAGK